MAWVKWMARQRLGLRSRPVRTVFTFTECERGGGLPQPKTSRNFLMELQSQATAPFEML